MSDNCQSIVDIDVSPHDAPAAADHLRAWLLEQGIIDTKTGDNVLAHGPGHFPGPRFEECLDPDHAAGAPQARRSAVCGVAFAIGRAVFDTGGNGTQLLCQSCRRDIANDDAYIDAVSQWVDGDDAAPYACPHCGHSQPVNTWDGPFVFGLGCLGVDFYNWPPLGDSFVASVARMLGHRVRLVRQHV